jgi:hypothetical protein
MQKLQYRVPPNRMDFPPVANRHRDERRFPLFFDPLSPMGVYLAISNFRRFSHPTCGDRLSEDTLVDRTKTRVVG